MRMGLLLITNFISLLICVSSIAANSTDAHQVYDLRQTVKNALKEATPFKNLEHKKEIASFDETSSLSNMLPRLDFIANHTLVHYDFMNSNSSLLLSDSTTNSGSPWRTVLALKLSENIYDNGISYYKYKRSQLQRKSVEQQVLQETNRLVFELVEKYLNYSYKYKILKLREVQLQALKKQFSSVESSYLQGLKARKDFLRIKSQVLRTEIEMSNIKNTLKTIKIDLLVLGGFITEKTSLQSDLNIEFVPMDLNEEFTLNDTLLGNQSLDSIITTTPLEKSYNLENEINSLTLNLTPKNYWPELSIQATAVQSSISNNQIEFKDNRSNHWEVGFSLKYNLLDWGFQASERAKSEGLKLISENEINKKRIDFKNELNLVYSSYKNTLNNTKISKELLTQEIENMALVDQEYRSGKVSYVYYIEAFNYLTDAQSQHYTNLLSLQVLKYKFYFYQGKINEFLAQ